MLKIKSQNIFEDLHRSILYGAFVTLCQIAGALYNLNNQQRIYNPVLAVFAGLAGLTDSAHIN